MRLHNVKIILVAVSLRCYFRLKDLEQILMYELMHSHVTIYVKNSTYVIIISYFFIGFFVCLCFILFFYFVFFFFFFFFFIKVNEVKASYYIFY
jgi:hypothetical protein